MRSLPFALVAPVLVTACAGSVEGTVDGESVAPLTSAFLAQPSVPGADKDLVLVTLASFGGACELYAEQAKQRAEIVEDVGVSTPPPPVVSGGEDDDEDDEPASGRTREDELEDAAEDCASFDEERFPAEYWLVTIGLRVGDAGDLEAGDTLQVDPDGIENVVAVCRQRGAPDFDVDVEAGPLGGWSAPGFMALSGDDNRDCFHAASGSIDLVRFDSDGAIELRADVALEDDGDDDAGDVRIAAQASFCGAAEDALEDWYAEAFPPVDDDRPGDGDDEPGDPSAPSDP